MEIQTKVNSLGILALLVAMLFCGCNSVIFPETNKTNDRDGEYVVINMLSKNEMTKTYYVEYNAVFGRDLTKRDAFGTDWAAEAGSKLLANIFDFAVEESKKATVIP